MLSPELVRSVLESAPDAMIIIDVEGRILFVNHQVSALFGYSRAQIIARSVDVLLPERFVERHAGHRHQYALAGQVRPMGIGLDLFARRKDGTEFPVEISLSPIQDGDTLLIAAAIRDVTERMRVDQELKEARAEADRANLAKSRFLATASHDLRQPLQSLALLNGTLRRLITTGDALGALEQQTSAISAMSQLLNALLDIGKLESGAIRPEIDDFNVAPLLDELRAEFAGLARAKGLELVIEPTSETLRSDASLVGQILRNLLSNAIKYTHGGAVRLRCQREANAVRIEVQDSGIGISDDQLGCIYDEFFQVGVATHSSRDGYGLGLSIVHRLVQLLQARIDVTSKLGAGSTFSLTLPVGAAIPAPAREITTIGSAAVAPSTRAQRHLLLVEDDPGVRNATRIFLKVEGYRVTATASLDEAVQAATDAPDIDLVVSDYHLGAGTTGTDVIASVRAVLGRNSKAILITGDTSSVIRDLHRDASLRIISKPIDADELSALLREMLAS